MQIEKIRRSLAFGTTLVCVSFFVPRNAAADSRKSTVTVSVTVSPSCKIDANGVDPDRCSDAARPIVSLSAPSPPNATTVSSAIRIINF